MMCYTKFDTRFCEIILAGDEAGLSHLHLNTGRGRRRFGISESWIPDDAFLSDAAKQVIAYFDGKLKSFHVPLNPQGTDFETRVWRELSGIPYGELRSYKDIAKAIGNEKAARAVGMANGKNPIPLIIPCHRVVGTDGSLTGFAHGLGMKEKLIRFEQANVSDGA